MTTTYDVICVGAGPCGLACAVEAYANGTGTQASDLADFFVSKTLHVAKDDHNPIVGGKRANGVLDTLPLFAANSLVLGSNRREAVEKFQLFAVGH